MSSDQNDIQEIRATKHEPGASWKENETHHLPENRLSVVRHFFKFLSIFDFVINVGFNWPYARRFSSGSGSSQP